MELQGWPLKAASLEMTTMRPARVLRNVGSSARVSDITRKKFVSITRRSSASGMSSKAPPAATPALFTTASRNPPVISSVSATPLAIAAVGYESRVCNVELHAADVRRRARFCKGCVEGAAALEVAHGGDDAPAAFG